MGKILIIDDDDQIRAMLRQALESVGHEVLEARNGEEGVQIYRRQPADLVITDILMPEREGLGCMVELQRLNPAVRVIAISGGSQAVTKDLGLELLEVAQCLGARRTFWKPFDLAKVLTAVQEELDDRWAA